MKPTTPQPLPLLDWYAIEALPTIAQGHTADLKIDDGETRIWFSRCGIEDGETRPISAEFYTDDGWIEAGDITETEACYKGRRYRVRLYSRKIREGASK